jgi:Tfp pilus assembly protein PilF
MKKYLRPGLFWVILIAFSGLMMQGCASPKASPVAASTPEEHFALAGREPIVLVCPIDSVTSNEETTNLSLIIAPLIRRDLFCVQQLSVIPSEDTYVPTKPYFLGENGLKQVGAANGADMVAVGMLSEKSGKVSIDFTVYDLKMNYFLLKTKVEGKKTQIFKLERKLVYKFIEALGIKLSKEESNRLASSSPKKFEAASEYGRGLNCERSNRYPEALVALRNALVADKFLALPYASEAKIYKEYNAPLKAMESYENAVSRDKFFVEAGYQLNLYAAQYNKDDKAALEYCRQTLAIAPRFGKAQLSLGTRLHDLGHLNEAIEETKKAIPLLRVDPLPRYNLGLYYLEAGQRDEARKWFERALEIDPQFQLAATQLEKLKGK